ncbi:hypothetical protein [Isoptericola croceus]|uniref:hypothetical protein n=1 Tax=Isoptericola croceus TaxID=3031406 RepID=UPI0023F77B66|nr:hypothetical protein [Isoptericola croceus]
MSGEDDIARRVRFFGVHDLAAGWYVPRVAELVERFDPANAPSEATDLLELHNVQQYLEHGFVPREYTESERAIATTRAGQIRSAVARFFSSVDNANCASLIGDVDHEYHADLLELLGRHKAFERCDAATMLQALGQAGVHLSELLACKKLVAAYDAEVRDQLLASAGNAEHLVRKHLQRDVRGEVHLPRSLTQADARELLERYVDSPDANPNYVGLIESAPVSTDTGVDAKLKLRAKRRNAEMTEKFFENNEGFKTGTEVGLSDTQVEPAKFEMDESDGLVARFTYSSRWLDETADNPSILNNFQHLFEFVDRHSLLSLPSYQAQLGVFERFMGATGKTHYQVGAGFRAVDMSSLLQTRLYQHYLDSKGRDLEEVVSWFFEEYLAEEFAARNFSFRPSSGGASYLERVRHLFAEMESVMAQFSLWVDNGELDPELLAITSDQVRYKQVPSLLSGKYVYPTQSPDIVGILNALFSDQSSLTYISDELRGDNAAELLLRNEVAYDDFHEYQRHAIDQLVALGILEDTGVRVRIANAEQFLILRSLFVTEACSYYHLSGHGRAEVDAMVARGWVERRTSLLTEAEGQYFNYFLNKVEFSNGPELRNKYLHGSQVNGEGEDAHFHAYVIALRLMIALVIKLNDDFCLTAQEQSNSETPK